MLNNKIKRICEGPVPLIEVFQQFLRKLEIQANAWRVWNLELAAFPAAQTSEACANPAIIGGEKLTSLMLMTGVWLEQSGFGKVAGHKLSTINQRDLRNPNPKESAADSRGRSNPIRRAPPQLAMANPRKLRTKGIGRALGEALRRAQRNVYFDPSGH